MFSETGKQSLSEVEPRHAGPVDRTQCDQCGESFRTPMGLYDHSFYHKGETICTREPCGRIVFKNRSKYIDHLNEKHESEIIEMPKSFECNKCDNKYVHIESLTKHMYVHTGMTICPYCTTGHRYGSMGNLWDHIKSKHPEKQSAPPQK
nr:PREDICTED: zinc finger protein 117-like [Bemisia tabaci]